jgi:WD40 repeat protein/serine/threonine protein kinase
MGDEPTLMKPASPEQVLFAEALQRVTPEARTAYLDAACGTDTALRQRVEVLLCAAENAGDFLEQPPTGLSGDADATQLVTELISEKPGDRIGRYKLLEQIGEGGCGTVYMAEQEEPVRRRVALKVIKLGMDTKQVIARFEAERQALALMDHPNIAKVLDGGATQTGRPYFVMELVRGVRITQFCDEARLSTEARLRLFVLVCQAVQHAHQKGIIHRDLKPSNILVTINDGTPVPKVIDFGIAKATGQRLTDKTVFTQFHSFIGTPAYTSPEQAEMSSVDIDTRSDIYSLGVLLYELLIGRTPFDGEELLRSGLDEMRRILRETEPVRPSTRLGTLSADELTTSARRRQTEPPKLIHRVRGDLDWIVMKALEKDRTRRYETASGLAGDVQRHLDNELIVARPPSTGYRFQKLIRRNKLAFAAGTAIALALVFGVVGSTWQAVRATKAEHAATLEGKRAEEQAQLASQEAIRATAEANRATAVATAARRYAYAAEINVALQALAENNLSRARELLDRQQPKSGEEDLRGFEWRYLWQLCRGDEFATFRHQAAHSAAFSPDGKLFAYAGGKITVRESASRKIVSTLPNPATTLSFAPHTNLLASGHDTGVKLWDTETWQEVRSLPHAMHPALFSPDGRWLLTGVAEGFRVWDTQTWQPMGLCTGVPRVRWNTRNAVAFSPDSQFLVTIAGEGLDDGIGDHFRVWRLPGLEKLPSLQLNRESNGSTAFSPPGSLTFLPGGKFVVTGLQDGQIVVWDFATRKVRAMRKEHTGWVTVVAVAPDGKTFATASSDRTVSLWDAATFKHLVRLRGHVGEVWSLAFAPDGRTMMSGSADGTTKLWSADARHDQILEGPNVLLGFIGDGRSLIAASIKSVSVWTPESGARVDFSFPTNPPISSVTLPPFHVKPHEPLAALGRSDGTVELWQLETHSKVTAWPAHKDVIGVVAFSPDGNWLATGTLKGEIKIWEFATRREVTRIGSINHKLLSLAFSPDGKTVAASGESSRVWLWEAATGREVVQLPGHGTIVPSVAFSPDGKMLATASLDNDARVWDVPSGKLRTMLSGHVQGVIAVAFSPDGKTLATGSHDRKVKLWDVATHQELATFPLGGLFPTLGFSPDGRMLAIGNAFEARIQVLPAPSFEEIAMAEAKPRGAVNP